MSRVSAIDQSHLPRALLLALACGLAQGHLTSQASSWSHPDGTAHWYEVVAPTGGVTWAEAHAAAAAAGGYLATITSSGENQFVFSLVDDKAYWTQPTASEPLLLGPWVGGLQAPGAQEPLGGWGWAELEAFTYQNWATNRPTNDTKADRVHFLGTTKDRTAFWGDADGSKRLAAFVIEYSGPFTRRTLGLLNSRPGAFDGYTLLNPLGSKETYLVDMRGRLVHSWVSQYNPGAVAELLPNGNLIRCGDVGNSKFAGGRGGIVEEFDWSGKVVWKFDYSSPNYVTHHDVERLANGNTLMIAWEVKTRAEALAAGRNPDLLAGDELWPDKIIEVSPAGKIVWEWNTWDHLIQDHDPTKANYGRVDQHPELVNLNYEANSGTDDWMHSNAICYNPKLDQIMLSVRHFNELWVIDHSTTTAEAASHKGGRSGKGGDLLYRWGNPQAYDAGTEADRRLFWQHDCQWIPDGRPGAGNIIMFNNGVGNPLGPVSTIHEFTPPTVDAQGNYPRTGKAWGPSTVLWTWPKVPTTDFFAFFVSSVQRLPNGNTLICDGQLGQAIEVKPTGERIWEFRNPLLSSGPGQQGESPVGATGGTSVFRATRYAATDPALSKYKLTAGQAIETYTEGLLVNESSYPLDSKVGGKIDLRLISKYDAGRVRLLGTSLSAGLIPVDTRFARIAPDSLAIATLLGTLPTVFPGYVGSFDANGNSSASIVIPDNKIFVGLQLHTMFLTIDPASPSGIGTISNTVIVNLTK